MKANIEKGAHVTRHTLSVEGVAHRADPGVAKGGIDGHVSMPHAQSRMALAWRILGRTA